jgi:serine/threonine-protein kinase
MAELFLGEARGAEGFHRKVAIKRVLPHLAQNPMVAKMFLAEAQLATHLHHQNIATVYDVGHGPEGVFLVMELVDGWDLGVLLRHATDKGQRFPSHMVAFIGTQVLAGLAHAYRRLENGRQVMSAHRDISPSNILVSREGEVKVTDFGIARVEGVSMGTEPGSFKGKVPYAAPEVMNSQPATAASDIFALGIVMYELLTGRHPFGDENTSLLGFVQAISTEQPPPLEGVPAPLAAVVMKALAKGLPERFAGPEQMTEALTLYLSKAGHPVSAQALAAYLKSLQPPQTLVEQAELARASGELDYDVRAVGAESPGLAQLASLPNLGGTRWQDMPGGPALSASGRLVPLSSSAPEPAMAAAPRPAAIPPPQPMPNTAPPLPWQVPSAEPLELARSPRRPVRARTPAPEFRPPTESESASASDFTRTVRNLLIGLGVLAVGFKLFTLALPTLRPVLMALPFEVPGLGPELSIHSTPPGASVRVEGLEVGTTPLSIGNTWPEGTVSVEVSLPGYRPWRGSFAGNQPVSLDAQLQRF